MQAQRDTQIYALYGQAKYEGNLRVPLFPSAGMLVKAGIGSETATTGITATGANAMAGTIASASAGATQISIYATSGTPVSGMIVQVGTGTPDVHPECRKIAAAPTGTSPYVCPLDQPVTYAHSAGTAVTAVTSPYTHTIVPATTLDSLTVEKCK